MFHEYFFSLITDVLLQWYSIKKIFFLNCYIKKVFFKGLETKYLDSVVMPERNGNFNGYIKNKKLWNRTCQSERAIHIREGKLWFQSSATMWLYTWLFEKAFEKKKLGAVFPKTVLCCIQPHSGNSCWNDVGTKHNRLSPFPWWTI